jgi:hypothetical protein
MPESQGNKRTEAGADGGLTYRSNELAAEAVLLK